MIFIAHANSVQDWEIMRSGLVSEYWTGSSLTEAVLSAEVIADEVMMFMPTHIFGDYYEECWLLFATLELAAQLDEFEIDYEMA